LDAPAERLGAVSLPTDVRHAADVAALVRLARETVPTEPEVQESLGEARDALAIPPEAIAQAIAFAIDQPADVDVNEIVVRPAAQA
jgi:NADP-dependent 3-hydroxy acid dehydrogenase YdfG